MAKRKNFGGRGANMNSMMKQVKKMQEEMMKAQEEAKKQVHEVSVGGGAVVVKMNGEKELVDVILDESVVDPEDIEMLQDLIISAVNEVIRKAESDMNSRMGQLTGGLSIPGL